MVFTNPAQNNLQAPGGGWGSYGGFAGAANTGFAPAQTPGFPSAFGSAGVPQFNTGLNNGWTGQNTSPWNNQAGNSLFLPANIVQQQQQQTIYQPTFNSFSYNPQAAPVAASGGPSNSYNRNLYNFTINNNYNAFIFGNAGASGHGHQPGGWGSSGASPLIGQLPNPGGASGGWQQYPGVPALSNPGWNGSSAFPQAGRFSSNPGQIQQLQQLQAMQQQRRIQLEAYQRDALMRQQLVALQRAQLAAQQGFIQTPQGLVPVQGTSFAGAQPAVPQAGATTATGTTASTNPTPAQGNSNQQMMQMMMMMLPLLMKNNGNDGASSGIDGATLMMIMMMMNNSNGSSTATSSPSNSNQQMMQMLLPLLLQKKSDPAPRRVL